MIYLFYGADDFGRNQAIQRLKAAIPPDVVDLNLTVFAERGYSVADLRSACDAWPLLHDRRLVITTNFLKHLRSTDAREQARALINRLAPTTDLVLNETDAPDKRLTLVKDIYAVAPAAATIRDFVPLEGAALIGWIGAQAQQAGVAIQPNAAQVLTQYVGNDGWMLHNEIKKLAAYIGYAGTIHAQHVQLLVTDETETNMFAFIDAVCERRGAAAVQALHGLLADGAAPLYILAMIARQVRLMLAAQGAGRVSANNLATMLGQKPFVARKALEQSRRYQPDDLRAFHAEVVAIDHGIKTGRVNAEAALELLVGRFGYPSEGRAILSR